ncbi:hypothetical protein G7K_5282-t1 [Saitoella complicata NRRL Y-17804]|uniref:Uncharacterized protein n=1 Tax=Saitoella complicata (strain BCRC 22490 / CBS 7301 / JCM 7358 / NBRC 10748 / NRRL Y-17804) TaxID=698492 RepID=A0A0E9NNA5_SAICN|nr:hypothetical protein G7K_5282-t1 [Saitoella complicata NRRL Y-17804]
MTNSCTLNPNPTPVHRATRKRHPDRFQIRASRRVRRPHPRTQQCNSRRSIQTQQETNCLTVGLGNTLELILLLDGVRVGRTLGSVDELLSQALSDGLDVAESSLTSTDGQEGDSLVDTAERGDIDGLATDGTSGTDTGGVLTGTTVDDSVDGDLEGVGIGQEVDDLNEMMLDNADSQQLLTVVTAVHHQSVGQTLNDGALSLPEPLVGVTTSSVGEVGRGTDLNVVGQGDVLNLNILVGPLVEELDGASLGEDILREGRVGDFGRHLCWVDDCWISRIRLFKSALKYKIQNNPHKPRCHHERNNCLLLEPLSTDPSIEHLQRALRLVVRNLYVLH